MTTKKKPRTRNTRRKRDLNFPPSLRQLGDILEVPTVLDDRRKKKRYAPTQHGTTSELGVCLFIARLFQLNEYFGTTAPYLRKDKMGDPEIQALIEKEFPEAKLTKRLKERLTINQLRQHYNSGILTDRISSSAPFSFRYNSKGEVVDGRFGRRVLTPEEVDGLITKAKEARTRRKLRMERQRGDRVQWWYGNRSGESLGGHGVKRNPHLDQKRKMKAAQAKQPPQPPAQEPDHDRSPREPV